MLVFPQLDPTHSHGFLLGKFNPRGPPTFKIDMKQEEPRRKKFQYGPWRLSIL